MTPISKTQSSCLYPFGLFLSSIAVFAHFEIAFTSKLVISY